MCDLGDLEQSKCAFQVVTHLENHWVYWSEEDFGEQARAEEEHDEQQERALEV